MNPQNENRNRTILVTGAASGIGAALCRRLAAPDITLFIHTRANRTGAEEVARAVEAKGGRSHLLLGDLADTGVAADLIASVASEGRLDGLVANAGFADKTPLASLEDDALAHSLAAITGGFHRLCRAAMPLLQAAEVGRVVAVSSFVAHRFQLDGVSMPASAAAKAGLEALARALAVDLAPHGVTVNCVAPGYVQKQAGAHAALNAESWRRAAERIPLGRLGQPDEIAALIEFLLSPDAAYITGQTIHADGGMGL
ncbi:MAG: SDR family oxidoreductase [Rhodospirillaceae bacterium]|nr:SDR family oxidoreductase [Rhodospirillaceae bacterium]MBT3492943.1 SDR family oxidoreductase [Rhodospirillaceae bacterium]MBT3780500.1 SDR family oxidoreductase [Rhodospirillaceae bacterium]MBT3977284.1 SDR family oxidoreductase [Rhodospirillaceae bacterium]MBT4167556.1 SDR family oxidoreductase [Rhodospirillaceae bacterium]